MRLTHKRKITTVCMLAVIILMAISLGTLLACTSSDVELNAEQTESSAVAPKKALPRLRVATTTSLYDTGLWGYLEPMFENKYGVGMDILSAGTGKVCSLTPELPGYCGGSQFGGADSGPDPS